MLSIDDINAIEGVTEADEMEAYQALQRAINDGTAWCFQGSYGRAMMNAIEEGFCLLGRKPARDYYGNRIPSRDEVKPGTKGSYRYVVERYGEAWAQEQADA